MASVQRRLRLCQSSWKTCRPQNVFIQSLGARCQSTQQEPLVQPDGQNGAAFHKLMSTLEDEYLDSSLQPDQNAGTKPSTSNTASAVKHLRLDRVSKDKDTAKSSGRDASIKPTANAATPSTESSRHGKRVESPTTMSREHLAVQKLAKQSARARVQDGGREASVKVKVVDGQKRQVYDPIFLRDSCRCPKCVDSSTRQKLFATTDIPYNIRVKDLWLRGTSIHITWTNDIPGYPSDHSTVLPQKFLNRAITKPSMPVYKSNRTIWDAQTFEQGSTMFDYKYYKSDRRILFLVLRQLQRYGLVFLQNVPGEENAVVDIATRIGPLKNTFYGDTWDVRNVAEAINVAYTSQDLGFHMDLQYMQQPPHLQFLHCLKASSQGGISLFSDSYKAANALYKVDRESFDALTKYDVNFHYDNGEHHYHQTRRVIEMSPGETDDSTDISANISGLYWSPPFQGEFHNCHGAIPLAKQVRRWHKAAQAFRDQIESKTNVYQHQLLPGQCVIFDNQRVLHARTAFSGGERWLKGCYVDWDPYMSKLRDLSRKFPELT